MRILSAVSPQSLTPAPASSISRQQGHGPLAKRVFFCLDWKKAFAITSIALLFLAPLTTAFAAVASIPLTSRTVVPFRFTAITCPTSQGEQCFPDQNLPLSFRFGSDSSLDVVSFTAACDQAIRDGNYEFLDNARKNVRNLDLLGCEETLTDETVERLVMHCPNLQMLSLNGTKMTNKALKSLSQLPMLESLHLVDFAHIEDETLESLKTLKRLRFERCRGLSKMSPALKVLERLEVINCLDVERLPRIRHYMPILTHLKVEGCPNLSFFSSKLAQMWVHVNRGDITNATQTLFEMFPGISWFDRGPSMTLHNSILIQDYLYDHPEEKVQKDDVMFRIAEVALDMPNSRDFAESLLGHNSDLTAEQATYLLFKLGKGANGNVVKILMDRGANFYAKDSKGRTPEEFYRETENYFAYRLITGLEIGEEAPPQIKIPNFHSPILRKADSTRI